MRDSKMTNEKGMRVLSPTGILGYGFPAASFERGIGREPDYIAVDAGSTDPGPYYLGSGKLLVGADNIRRDLRIILPPAVENNIPVIIGSAGGAGTAEHLSQVEAIIGQIASENRLNFRLGTIKADIGKDRVLESFDAGRITATAAAPGLRREDIMESTEIVAQMGHEPIIEALERGCEVILCGRCYDPSAFAAGPIKTGFGWGLAYHMGKILECAAIAAVPGSGRDCVLGTIAGDHFRLEALNDERRFTVASTSAHSLYEKSDPYRLPGPGGAIDLTQTHFEAVNDRVVKVSGSRFVPTDEYMIKLEGAKPQGHRTVSIAGVRDPILIETIDDVIASVQNEAEENFAEHKDKFQLVFHVYGKDGVMGVREPVKDVLSHELGLVMEVIAETRGLSESVCSFVRSTFLHYGYPGRVSTAGNLAFLHSPSDIYCGRVYGFSIYHLMPVDHPEELFPVKVREL